MSRASELLGATRLMVVVSGLCMLAGCQDAKYEYFTRHDTISYQAGDDVAANKAIQIIDPWPDYAADTRIPTSGRRVARAIENYEAGPKDSNASGAAPGGGIVITPIK
jgi:hypothetical protein